MKISTSKPKGADYAKDAVALVARGTRSHAARVVMATAAIGPHGNYTPEGKAVWAAYLAEGAPRT